MHDPTELIGRRAELNQLRELCEGGARLVTICGPPGIGKTRLAHELAGIFRAEGWRVAFVDLAACRSADGLPDAILGALEDTRAADASAALGAWASRHASSLLILDNFEQLVGGGATVLQDWLATVPSLVAIVTSRTVLALRAEQRMPLSPLSNADGVQLFLQRAQAAGATSSDARSDVARLVQRLDGIPLAIELAAAQTDALSVSQLLGLLERGTRVLRADHRDRKDATLEEAVRTSWELASDAERALLEQSTVFRGDFDLAAAESVVELPTDVATLEVVRALVAKSLLNVHPDPSGQTRRYRTFEFIREFAERQVDERTREAATERHLHYFLGALGRWEQAMGGPDRDLAIRSARADLDNVRAAVERSRGADPALAARLLLVLARVLDRTGPVRPSVDAFQSVLEALGDGEPLLRARLHAERARVFALHARSKEALRDLARCRALISPEAAPSDLTLLVRTCEGILTMQTGRVDEGLSMLAEGLLSADPGSAAAVEAKMFTAIGEAARGNREAAIEILRAGAVAARGVGSAHLEARHLTNLGFVRHLDGDLDGARDTLREAARVAEGDGDRTIAIIAHLSLAHVWFERGEIAELADTLRVLDAIVDPVVDGSRVSFHHRMCRSLLSAEEGSLDAATEALEGAKQLASRAELGAGSTPVETFEGVLELARARRALARGGPAEPFVEAAEGKLRAARERAADPGHREEDSLDAATGIRLLEAALSRYRAMWMVARDASWCRRGDGARVDLARRKVLCSILRHLADARTATPGQVVPYASIRAAGWPGQKMSDASAIRRIYVAIGDLRKLGVDEILMTGEGGYLLDPTTPLYFGEPPSGDDPAPT